MSNPTMPTIGQRTEAFLGHIEKLGWLRGTPRAAAVERAFQVGMIEGIGTIIRAIRANDETACCEYFDRLHKEAEIYRNIHAEQAREAAEEAAKGGNQPAPNIELVLGPDDLAGLKTSQEVRDRLNKRFEERGLGVMADSALDTLVASICQSLGIKE